MSQNIAYSLSKISETKKDEIGLVEARTGNKYSFTYLEKKSNQYAWHFRKHGVLPGDRVMLMVKPSVDFICLTFALFKLGSPVILIDPGMGYKNLLRCVEGVNPRIFIGIPKAHLFLSVFRKHFSSIRLKFCLGPSFFLFGQNLKKSVKPRAEKYPVYDPDKNDLAAIIFTTGSTGPPKGVRYEHSIFAAQLKQIKSYYKIGERDIDQPAFPLFALFSTALGACAVIPDMDPTQPAKVNPEKFVQSIIKYRASYSFGSPALWNVVSKYCLEKNITMTNLQKVLMAGAPVPGELIKKVYKVISPTGEIHTPYGATECLPIVSAEGKEIISKTWPETQKGKGTCVGRPLPDIELLIISIIDGEIERITDDMILGKNRIGEIVVCGDVVTQAYENNAKETELAKTRYNGRLWHRMGDAGYRDDLGRLWFCGRKSHRVETANGTKFTIPCEAIINNHPDVFRSALVGIKADDGAQEPVVIIELEKNCRRKRPEILNEIKILAGKSKLTADIKLFCFHEGFPVDIRHNAKIFREKLSDWAENILRVK